MCYSLHCVSVLPWPYLNWPVLPWPALPVLPGPVIAPGQQARQILEEPNSLVNEVTFKTLGFIPGYSRQYGTIQPVSGDTFIVSPSRTALLIERGCSVRSRRCC